jgi:hypothetical protein
MDVFGILTAAGFVVAVVPYLMNGYKRVTRVRVMRVFWDGKDNTYVIVHPVHEDPTSFTKEHRLIKHETVSAVRRLEEFLKSHGCAVSVKRACDPLTREELTANLVILGSSRTNPVVKSTFPELEEFFTFGATAGDYHILDVHNKVSLCSPMNKGVDADLALIIKIANRFSRQSANRVYYVAGIHAIGGWAAAEYLTNYAKLHKLRKCAPDKGLALVIEATFNGFYNITDFNDYVGPRFF